MIMPYSSMPMEQYTSTVNKPNLLTGEGCGHYRPLDRERKKKGYHKAKHDMVKMAKNSRRRNRT